MRALARDPRRRPTAAGLRDEIELWLRKNPCTAADIERYLLEIIPTDSPDRTKARKLLEQAPLREPSQTDPTRLPPPSKRPPGPDEHTVRERILRAPVLVPVGIALLLAIGAVGFLLSRSPQPVAPPQTLVVTVPPPAPIEVPVPPPSLAPEPKKTSPAPEPHEREVPKRSPRHSESAVLTVRARPRCELFIDGERNDRPLSRELSLSPGTHTLRFVNRALHLDAVRTVKLEAGQRAVEQFNFSSRPIAVRISPWAYVTVDDEKYGATPMLNRKLSLYEGTHKVALRYGSKTAAVNFKVSSSGENELRYSFSR